MQTQVLSVDENRPSRSPRRAVVALLTLILILLYARSAHAQDDGTTSDVSTLATRSVCDLSFQNGAEYAFGLRPSIAMNKFGLVVEVHESSVLSGDAEISYIVGKVNGSSVTWGNSYVVPLGLNDRKAGYYPAVALTNSGLVILVFQYYDGRANPNYLWYKVGQLDPNGDADRRILWLNNSVYFDRGNRPSISVNDNGLIVAVFETGSGGNGLYYRIGQLATPPKTAITWTSGEYGIRYTGGVYPHIAINNRNQVLEVHQVQDNENLLHYIRGTVSAPFGGIAFAGDQPRYGVHRANPSVALLDNGLVIEAHRERLDRDEASALDGGLDIDYPAKVNWGCSARIDPGPSYRSYPQVAGWRQQCHPCNPGDRLNRLRRAPLFLCCEVLNPLRHPPPPR